MKSGKLSLAAAAGLSPSNVLVCADVFVLTVLDELESYGY